MKKCLFIGLLAMVMGMNDSSSAADSWVVYEGGKGPGAGKHIVLISGDEEYRSEEALPCLGKILSVHHGFKCTVLFAIDPKSGAIDPNQSSNIPGLKALETADLCIMLLRFRDLPDDQMKYIVDYVEAGKPIVGMRTSTHAFNIRKYTTYKKYSNGFGGNDYKGGFGRQVLGEKWISHHGGHKRESTRGLIAPGAEKHAIVTGIKNGDIWGPTDVYGVRLPLPGDSKPIVLGQVLVGMKFDDAPLEGKKNNPMMPVAWTKSYKGGRIFNTTMGSSTDLVTEGTRRMLVNGAYWCLGMESQIQADSSVELVGEFKPTAYGFGGFKKGVMPAAHRLGSN
ncbi:MAG: ThuA domain-containing protein [Pirellulaceae bacterium]